MIKDVKWLPFGVIGLTFYPFIFLKEGMGTAGEAWVIAHEAEHFADQERWFKRAWYFGLLAWYFAYLFLLPALWNPLRRKTETKAYRVNGYTDVQINEILRKTPYWLIW